jgi:hypothetical protein
MTTQPTDEASEATTFPTPHDELVEPARIPGAHWACTG